MALRAGPGAQARRAPQRRAIQGLGAAGGAGAYSAQARRVRRRRPADGQDPRRGAHRRSAGGRGSLRPGAGRGRSFGRRCSEHFGAAAGSRPRAADPHPRRAQPAPCAGRRLRPLRRLEERLTMERTEVLDMMGELKLYGMKAAYDETLATALKRQHEPQRFVGDLLRAEISEKQARSIKYQITASKLPLAKDLDGFAFKDTPINEALVRDLAGSGFIAQQRNAVFIGGTGTGKTHAVIAIARSCIRAGRRGRFFTTVDLVNQLEAEARAGRQGRIADYLSRMDFVVLDELGYLPFAQAGGQLLFHLVSRLYERPFGVPTRYCTGGSACLISASTSSVGMPDPSTRRAAPCRIAARSGRGSRAASCPRCCRTGPRKPAATPPGSSPARSRPARSRADDRANSRSAACRLGERVVRPRNKCWSDRRATDRSGR